MRKLIYILLLTLACGMGTISAQKENNIIRKGNKMYDKQQYDAANTEYKKALERNRHSFAAKFNMGDALFKQEKYEDAAKSYQEASAFVNKDTEKDKVAMLYHNIGNCLFATQQYEQSIEAYKEALRANPLDDETRYNLAVAKMMLKKQQQNQDQQQQQQQQQQNQDQQQQQNQDQQQQQNESDMTEEKAERILQALEQDEKDTQEKVQEAQRVRAHSKQNEKDW